MHASCPDFSAQTRQKIGAMARDEAGCAQGHFKTSEGLCRERCKKWIRDVKVRQWIEQKPLFYGFGDCAYWEYIAGFAHAGAKIRRAACKAFI